MKRTLTAAILGAALVAVPAQAHNTGATINIRHQVRGCHTWSVNGGVYKAKQSVRIERGATITFVNNDVMPHKLVKISGPKVVGHKLNMNHMSAMGFVKFTKRGLYKFKMKAGEDYKGMKHIATKGKDNVLRLTVRVK